jgi:hypothetical protein
MRFTPLYPDDPSPDQEQRLAALHALGPMEFDLAEQTSIESALAELNTASKAAMDLLASRSQERQGTD